MKNGQLKNNKPFSLFQKAVNHGVLKAESGWLISAPTATGKSYIGLEIIKRNLADKPDMDIFLYLVPFKALAEEIYTRLRNELPDNIRLHIKTGDYDKQFDLNQTDVLVATYESIDGIIQSEKLFCPSIIIADECSIISDNTRGSRIESLIAYLAKMKSGTILYVLSAVLDDPKRIAEWLNLNLLEGTSKDRQVRLNRNCIYFSKGKKKEAVKKIVKDSLPFGNIIVFCGTKNWTEGLANELCDTVNKFMGQEEKKAANLLGEQLKKEFPYMISLQDLISKGIAYHHAGLEVDLRKRISDAFRERKIKIICATPTLSAGVNLPARFVIVKDLKHGRESISVAEIVNMLGRAGRPGYDKFGTGYFLFPREHSKKPNSEKFITRVKKSKVEKLESQIGKSTTNALYFVLSSAARFKGLTREELIEVYNTTLWGHENPLQAPLLSTIDSARRIESSIQPPSSIVNIEKISVKIHNQTIQAKGGKRNYEITINKDKCSCTCPDYKMRHNHCCKHIKQLRYEAVLGEIGKNNPQARNIAIESLQTSGLPNDPMYMLSNSVDLLLSWNFIEESKETGKLIATRDGLQALSNYLLDMAHVRLLRDRIANCKTTSNEEEIIEWAIQDYRKPGNVEENTESPISDELQQAIKEHIKNKSYKEILPQKQIQAFLEVKDRMDQMFRSYLAFCPKNNEQLRKQIKTARRRLHYGCQGELLPLMILNLLKVNEASKAMILFKTGIKNVIDLSGANPFEIAQLLKITEEEAKNTLKKTRSITQLVQNFQPTEDMSALNMLAIRTEIKTEDLADYLLSASDLE